MKISNTINDFDRINTHKDITPRNIPKSENVKDKIKESINKYISQNAEKANNNFQNIKYSRDNKKLELFKNVEIDINNIQSYIKTKSKDDGVISYVKIGDVKTSFYSKFENIEQSNLRAVNFLKNVIKLKSNLNIATLSN